VPDHTIPSAGAALRQSLVAEVGEGAALIAVDAFAAGRVARGEAWRFAELDSALVVRDARGLVLHDRFVLRDGAPRGLGIEEGRPYFATVVVVGDTGIDVLAEQLAVHEAVDGAEIGVGVLARRGAIVRCLAADAPALGRAVDTVWRAARRGVMGLLPLALRKG
jgi:urease accessory protein